MAEQTPEPTPGSFIPDTLRQGMHQGYYSDMPPEEFDKKLQGEYQKDRWFTSKMADKLYEDFYSDLPREEFDARSGYKEWEDAQTNTIEQWGNAILAAGKDAISAVGMGAHLTQRILSQMPDAGAMMHGRPLGERGQTETVGEQIGQAGLDLSIAMSKSSTEDRRKQAVTYDEWMSAPLSNLPKFVAAHGPAAMVEFAYFFNPIGTAAFMATHSTRMMHERMERDKRFGQEPTGEDVLIGMGLAGASTLIEKLAFNKVITGSTATRMKKRVEQQLEEAKKRWPRKVAERAGVEATQEVVQEAGIETYGVGLGTETPATEKELKQVGITAGTLGFFAGGGMAGGSAALGLDRSPAPEEGAPPDATSTQETPTEEGTEPSAQPPSEPAPGAEGEKQAPGMGRMILEEEVKQGKRAPLDMEGLQVGDKVTVGYNQAHAPETGKVDLVTPELIRVSSLDGERIIGTIRRADPDATGVGLYAPTETEVADIPTEGTEPGEDAVRVRQELTRLLARLEEDSTDAQALKAIQKIQGNRQLYDLLEDEDKNELENIVRQRVEEQEARELAEKEAAQQEPESEPAAEPEPEPEPETGTELTQPGAELTEEDTRRPLAFDPTTLQVDAERFQFKGGGDTQGVNERLRGVKEWDYISAGVGVIWEAKDGTRYVVDGHQRVALAKRLAEEGETPLFNAYLFREADGITAEEARAEAALKNIREGSGSAVDAARVLKTIPEDRAGTLSTSDAFVSRAKALSQLDNNLLSMVAAGRVDEKYAAVIADKAKDDVPLQTALFKMFADRAPASIEEAATIADQYIAARQEDQTETDLFGESTTSDSLYYDRAKVLIRAQKMLREDKRIFAMLTDKASAISAAGNVLAGQQNVQRKMDAEKLLAHVTSLANRKGPVSEALTEAAKALRGGKKVTDAARDFLSNLQGADLFPTQQQEQESATDEPQTDLFGGDAEDTDTDSTRGRNDG